MGWRVTAWDVAVGAENSGREPEWWAPASIIPSSSPFVALATIVLKGTAGGVSYVGDGFTNAPSGTPRVWQVLVSNFFGVGMSKPVLLGQRERRRRRSGLCSACPSSNIAGRVALGFTVDTPNGRRSLSMLTGCRGSGTPPTTPTLSRSSPLTSPFPALAPTARAERLPLRDLCPRLRERGGREGKRRKRRMTGGHHHLKKKKC
uniref:Uncharacterized protein n=1 Tax=Oryza meridionalis TaxID=40149 RepID=A0A0E0DC90_9ORYZ